MSVWGKGAVNLEKLKCWEDRLIGIGWGLDLESWRAQPNKDRGMAKLVVALFDVVPPGTVFICWWRRETWIILRACYNGMHQAYLADKLSLRRYTLVPLSM